MHLCLRRLAQEGVVARAFMNSSRGTARRWLGCHPVRYRPRALAQHFPAIRSHLHYQLPVFVRRASQSGILGVAWLLEADLYCHGYGLAPADRRSRRRRRNPGEIGCRHRSETRFTRDALRCRIGRTGAACNRCSDSSDRCGAETIRYSKRPGQDYAGLRRVLVDAQARIAQRRCT